MLEWMNEWIEEEWLLNIQGGRIQNLFDSDKPFIALVLWNNNNMQ